jgi:hypothetical protein
MKRKAAARVDPPRRALAADVSSIRNNAVSDPESTPFEILNQTHKVLRFSSDAEVTTFVEELYLAIKADRVSVLAIENRAELRRWLGQNRDDPEWQRFLATASDKWKEFPA